MVSDVYKWAFELETSTKTHFGSCAVNTDYSLLKILFRHLQNMGNVRAQSETAKCSRESCTKRASGFSLLQVFELLDPKLHIFMVR